MVTLARTSLLLMVLALVAGDDIFHVACFRLLCSNKSIRISLKLDPESRQLIDDARRQTQTLRGPTA